MCQNSPYFAASAIEDDERITIPARNVTVVTKGVVDGKVKMDELQRIVDDNNSIENKEKLNQSMTATLIFAMLEDLKSRNPCEELEKHESELYELLKSQPTTDENPKDATDSSKPELEKPSQRKPSQKKPNQVNPNQIRYFKNGDYS